MTSYLVILFLLMMCAIGIVFFPKYEKHLSYLSTTILILFAGLRFQTGYDWPAYEYYFSSMVSVKEAFLNGIPNLPILAEPLYMLLNMLVKSFTSNLLILFLLIAVINLSLMHYVLSKISSVSFVWIFYFGFGFLIAQMCTLRQGLASSFVLLALFWATQKNRAYALAAITLALGFHVSAIMFIPLIFLQKQFPSKKIIFSVLFFGAVCLISGTNLTYYFLNLAQQIPSEWAAKFTAYLSFKYQPLSIATLGIIFFHVAVLFFLSMFTTPEEKKSSTVITAIWLTMLSLVTHLYFSGFPTVWSRVMLVTTPWQIATVYKLTWVQKLNRITIISTIFGLFLLSFASLTYTLSKPDAQPFRPYYSIVDVYFHGVKIDEYGRKRITDYILRYQKEVEKNQK